MKTKLINALATRFVGVDAKILSRIADNILSVKTIETDDEVNSAAEEVTFADILKSYGDSRATEATKSAVLNYEKKHNIKDGKPVKTEDVTPTPPTDGDNSAVMELLKRMDEKMTAQADEIQRLKSGMVTDARTKRLNDTIKGLKDSQKKAYKRIAVDNLSDDDFEALMSEIAREVSDLIEENKAVETSGFSPLFGGTKHNTDPASKASDDEINEVVAKLAKV